jgi:hypothetical protein
VNDAPRVVIVARDEKMRLNAIVCCVSLVHIQLDDALWPRRRAVQRSRMRVDEKKGS